MTNYLLNQHEACEQYPWSQRSLAFESLYECYWKRIIINDIAHVFPFPMAYMAPCFYLQIDNNIQKVLTNTNSVACTCVQCKLYGKGHSNGTLGREGPSRDPEDTARLMRNLFFRYLRVCSLFIFFIFVCFSFHLDAALVVPPTGERQKKP